MRVVLITVVLAAVVCSALPVSAHHAWPVSMAKLVTVKGTVKSVTWANPHPMFTVEVRAESGAIEIWQGRPNRLHDRIHFLRGADGAWRSQPLSP